MLKEPILLIPAFRSGRETPWAGDMLRKEYQKYTLGNMIGESYDFSLLPGLESTTPSGKTLRDLLSVDSSFHAESVPFIVKWTDAQDATSIHLHPNHDEYLLITNTYNNAQIVTGVKPEFEHGTSEFSENDFQFTSVHTGDVLHIPAGVPHALCGITCWTIQQAENEALRLFDWNRTNARGFKRTLHNINTAHLLSTTSVKRLSYETVDNESLLFSTDSFSVSMIQNAQNYPVTFDGAFAVMTCLEPAVLRLKNEKTMYLTAGQSIYIPRNSVAISIDAARVLLSTAHV